MKFSTTFSEATLPPIKQELGKTYGFLTVIAEGPMRRNLRHWICKCSCGNTTVPISGASLRSGGTISCGCAKKVFCGARTHGMTGHPALASYKSAKSRCNSESNSDFAYYGGRGIQFLLPSFAEFWEVMGKTWFKGATIDRIDVNGHYEFSNLRWATRKEQSLNTRNSVILTHNGIAKNLSLWAEELGVNSSSLRERIEKWGVEKALSTPRQENGKFITYDGVTLNKSQWAKKLGVDLATMLERLEKWPLEKALTTTNQRKLKNE